MPDLQEFETATSTESLLPVELTIHDPYGRETRCVLRKLPAIIGRDKGADVQPMDPWIIGRQLAIRPIPPCPRASWPA